MKYNRTPREAAVMKELRKTRTGLSQIQFAESIGLNRQVIEHIEQGTTSCHNLKYSTLKTIANGLLETPETLIEKLTFDN